MKRVNQYLLKWEQQGYSSGIPDEVPMELQRLGIAPSWKAIACAILKNDMQFITLGFSGKETAWYSALKKIEFEGTKKQNKQLDMFYEEAVSQHNTQ